MVTTFHHTVRITISKAWRMIFISFSSAVDRSHFHSISYKFILCGCRTIQHDCSRWEITLLYWHMRPRFDKTVKHHGQVSIYRLLHSCTQCSRNRPLRASWIWRELQKSLIFSPISNLRISSSSCLYARLYPMAIGGLFKSIVFIIADHITCKYNINPSALKNKYLWKSKLLFSIKNMNW